MNSGNISEKKDSETSEKGKNIIHRPLSYGKKFYLGEFIAERVIQLIAILSIGIIMAIFYFVFNESIYAFIHSDQITSGNDAKTEQINANEVLSPQSYTADGDAPTELKSETYSPDGDAPTELKSETYSPDGETPAANNKPLTYGDVASDSTTNTAMLSDEESLEYQEDVPVKVSELILPNDTIEGKASYIWQPISKKPKFNFLPLFIGSLKVTTIGILIAAPIAILAAIFTVIFATKRQKEIIKPIIEIIAGFPSVVIGFFALITLASVLQNLFGTEYRLNAFVAGVGIAIAVIPIIYTVTEDSMSFIPKHLREASLSLGATRWQTAIRVIVPAATPGIFAAIILGFGRAFGETMIVLMATGNAALMSLDIFEPVRTLSATIGAEMAEVEFRGVHYGVLFLIGSLLFVITFGLNALAEFYVKKKLIKRMQGK
jgi:phosphate transport system permease protein